MRALTTAALSLGLAALIALARCTQPVHADFTIPNVSDAFDAKQSEVDKVDLDILVAGQRGDGVISGAAVSAQGTPDMTVAVASGVVKVGATVVSVSSGNVTIPTAHATNPRFDLVVVSDTGTKSVTAGTAAAAPVFPAIPASSVVLASVYVPANDTAIQSNQITDKRVLLGNPPLVGVISPAQLTTNQNDWAPTGCSTAAFIRFSADQPRNITGLACSNAVGMVRVLQNVGTGNDSVVVLKNADTGSTAANRFDFDHDVTLAPKDTIVIWYDGLDSRWKQFALDPRFDQDRRRMPLFETDYLGAVGAATLEAHLPWDWAAISTGTQANVAGTPNHPGIVSCTSSTTANSGCKVKTNETSFLFGGGERTEFIASITTLTNGTFRFGWHDATTSTDAVDGAYIEVPATGAAVCKTSNNSTRTTSATIATLSTATWYHLRISVDATAANVTCEIFDGNGNSLGSQTNSANIPTAAGREFGHGWIATNSGTTATALLNMDYQALWWERALVRGR